SFKRRKKYCDMDGEIDINRALTGSMTPFRKKVVVKSKGRSLNIYISLSASAGESGETVARFTQQATQEIYKYVAQGRMVSVDYIFPSKNIFPNAGCMVQRIRIKDPRQPIDFKRLSCIAYPAFFR